MKNKALLSFLTVLVMLGASPLFALSLRAGGGGGAQWVTGDRIDSTEMGYNFKGLLEAEIWRGFSYGFRYSYSSSPAFVPNDFNTDTSITSYNAEFIHQSFQLTNTWSPGWRWVDPYLRGAAGINVWQERSADTLAKSIIINASTHDTTTNEVKGVNFGIGLGGGIEIAPFDFVGLRLGVDYDLIFSEDKEKFGSNDANENLLRVGAELIFRIPIK